MIDKTKSTIIKFNQEDYHDNSETNYNLMLTSRKKKRKWTATNKNSNQNLSRMVSICSIVVIFLTLFKPIAAAAFKGDDKHDNNNALRISSIEVPAAVMNGSQITLVCNYDLQGDQPNQQDSSSEEDSPSSSSSSSSSSSTPRLVDGGVKQEFELNGINLNLAKSNRTHVQLRQTNLASEGTYKCEVSADSPSFATISIERQMKVYVLPKQKLSIIDNVAASGNSNGQSLNEQLQRTTSLQANGQPPPLDGTSAPVNKQPVYNINDIVNLTCTSGPSKPAAKLSWVLNDLPIVDSSKWLSQPIYVPSANNEQLVESRSTLSFRLQPEHLETPTGTTTAAQTTTIAALYQNHAQRFQLLRIKCLATLSVEYQTQTSILVSGGKTTLPKAKPNSGQQQQQQTPMPSASSLVGGSKKLSNRQSSLLSARNQSQQLIQATTSEGATSIYRWPRPPSQLGQLGLLSEARQSVAGGAKISSTRRNTSPHSLDSSLINNNDPWPSNILELSEQTGGSTDSLSKPNYRAHYKNQWSTRQLRSQAEHIEQLLKLFRPNELDTPLIDAKLIEQQAAGGLENQFSPEDVPSTEAPAAELDQDAGLPSTPKYAEEEEGGEVSQAQDSNRFNSNSRQPNLALSNSNTANSFNSYSRDYELNDLVKFTCRPRVGSLLTSSSSIQNTGSNTQLAQQTNSKSIKSIWSINNNDVDPLGQVNAFDSTTNKFYFVKDQYDTERATSHQPVALELSNNQQTFLTKIKSSSSDDYVDVVAGQSSDISSSRTMKHMNSSSITRQQQQRAETIENNNNNNNEEVKSLLIEFTQSLFQAKELNLKCRTVIEQPLIEYESQLVALVPTNQFIQANNSNSNFVSHNKNRNSQSNHNHSPSRYNTKLRENQRNKNQNSRNYHQYQQESSSSSPSSKFVGWSIMSLWPLMWLLLMQRSQTTTTNIH